TDSGSDVRVAAPCSNTTNSHVTGRTCPGKQWDEIAAICLKAKGDDVPINRLSRTNGARLRSRKSIFVALVAVDGEES
ncbi:hypothetical protein CEXT_675871, partial [Caerostris extrusa]